MVNFKKLSYLKIAMDTFSRIRHMALAVLTRQYVVFLMAVNVVWTLSASTAFSQNNNIGSSRNINFNQGWEFTSLEFRPASGTSAHKIRGLGADWEDQFTTETVNKADGYIHTGGDLSTEMSKLEDNKWQNVVLPHIAFPEPVPIEQPREGFAYYRKSFKVSTSLKGKKISLEFEGAMQIAEVWVNGKFVRQHLGGYLPFTVDLTDRIEYGKVNTIFVKLDNRANPLIPPGKPVKSLDFIYYSGIYRDVWLHVTDPLHITDANVVDKVAGGGVFVRYSSISDQRADLEIATDVINESSREKNYIIEQQLLDSEGRIAATWTTRQKIIAPGKDAATKQSVSIANPNLWSPDHPYLYKLISKVIADGITVDQLSNKIGIRSFNISREKGLLINGKPFRITGTNRHMNYPWIGNSLSDNATRRDAIIMKNAGMNCIRVGHYPQDPSFYDACDSLGLLLVNCTPGWQFFNKSTVFKHRVFEGIRQMIRRDRNHPSVLLWEVSLNEAYPPTQFRCEQNAVAKSEWPDSANFFTSGDSYFAKACWDVPYDDWNGDPGKRNNTTYLNHAFLIREYGDYEFGGGNSTSRKSRGEGEKAMLQQAWNLQWEHNRNRKSYPASIGDLTWAFFDGLAGVTNIVETWGMADLYRIPKFSYYFFQSQQIKSRPMVYIASYWQKNKDLSPRKVIVYSNSDSVTLYVNNRPIATRTPDNGADKPYGTELDKGGQPFGGGDARHLNSPPFTFKEVTFTPGDLKAVAYRAGKEIATTHVYTPGAPAAIQLTADEQGIPLKADGADVIFVRATIVDSAGHPVYMKGGSRQLIHFAIKGDAKIVSPAETLPEAGIATILVQAGQKSGRIRIEASMTGLPKANFSFKSQ